MGIRAWRFPSTLALFLALSADTNAQPLTFARDDYPSSAGARAIASADFNRDGWPDVAQANTGRNTVTILLNQRGAGLTRTADISVAAGPFDLATSDFNRDAIPDLAVANADGNTISVLTGNGDGTFTRSDLAVAGQGPRGVAAADLNNDGKPDLVYSGYDSGRVQVLLGNGAGGFAAGPSSLRAGSRPQGITPGDFNRDGFLDLAVADVSSSGLRILFGSSSGALTARAVPGEVNLNVVEAGDFNRDGWLDLAAASSSNSTVSLYMGGPGGIVRARTYPVGSSPRGITVTDLNDDGRPDVVTANRNASTVSVLIGDREHPGTFLPAVEMAADAGSRDVAAADFDGDGVTDLATGNEYASRASVFSNTTSFTPAGYAFRPTSRGSGTFWAPLPDSIQLADFNHDGQIDIATGADDLTGISILPTGAPAVTLSVGDGISAFRAADFNADGNSDVLYVSNYVSNSSSRTAGVYLGDGRGSFTSAPTLALISSSGSWSVAVGDLNKDGRPDFAYSAYFRTLGQTILQLVLGRGDGTFQTASEIRVPGDIQLRDLIDVDRDGKLDAVLSSGQVWRGNGAGALASSAIQLPAAGLLADVNRDGRLDILLHYDNLVDVFLGRDGGYDPPLRSSAGPEAFGSIAVGDVNADGKPDVVVTSGHILFGQGDGTFDAPGGRFDFGAPWGEAAYQAIVADATGDGVLDLLTTARAGEVRVLAGDRTTVNLPPTVNAGPDRTIEFADIAGEDCDATITAVADDPDAHALSFEWRNEKGEIVSSEPVVSICRRDPGSYVYSVVVRDGRGGAASDTVTVTRVLRKEIVLWVGDAEEMEGSWTFVADATAAGGTRMYDPNRGAPKVGAPVVEPSSRFVLGFYPEPTLAYKLWIRLKADGNSWANDSVWVQFTGATDASGTPKYEWFTHAGLAINLEECSGCGVSGWGWEDDGWGAVNKNGELLYFRNPDRDRQYIVIQPREDGVSIDQVVLSAEKYLTTRPGTAKNDKTILPNTPPR